jgi:hypothetical protein
MLLFIIPLIGWIVIAKIKFGHQFTWPEMAVQGVFTAAAIALLTLAGYHSQTSDTMLVNGVVTDTQARKQQCNQMWSDWPDGFCTNQYTRSVRDGETCTTVNNKRTCTPKYKTQYKSIYPWEIRYFVSSDIPSSYEISRVDAQGAVAPPRFTEINKGDPVTTSVTYTNYIKGAADTLFNQKYEDVPPIAYPKVYDYYKTRRVIYFGTPASADFVQQWNEDLSVVNSEIRKTGANVIINVVGESQDWAERLAQAWDAHNINDVVVTLGVEGERIQWVDVRSWSSNELVDITIRDEILNVGVVDPTAINAVIKSAVTEYYKAQEMSEFEYLAEDIPAPTWLYVLIGIILLIVTPITTWILSTNNVTELGGYRTRNNRF